MNTREVGTVHWFNNTKGFGYVQRNRDKNDFLVSLKNIRDSDKGYYTLSEGDAVTFFIKQEKGREVADDVVVFDTAEAKEARLAILLGLFKPSGSGSPLQQACSTDSAFEQKLVPMVFEFAGIFPKK